MDTKAIVIFSIVVLVLIGLCITLLIQSNQEQTINLPTLNVDNSNLTATNNNNNINNINSNAISTNQLPPSAPSPYPPMSPELKQQLENIYGRQYYDNCRYELRMLPTTTSSG